ncbi:Polysaccharide biosynthesis protein [Roseimaritima multifibrata]|uniref:Polysaccharide biosynthesis protein n=2 Tax=Roseimaritima multifibrata TaxID=1930274 RepID=A0A517MJR9_9BACT|nr:Polysaccharide biosynthesis protein [Roseimaritima multifibrata]
MAPSSSLLMSVARALIGRGLGAAAQLVVTFALGHLFGADGTGTFMLALTFFLVCSLLGRRGLDFALLRIASEAWGAGENDRFWSNVWAAIKESLIYSVAISTCLLLTTGWLAESVFHDQALRQVLPWIALAIPGYAVLALCSECHKAIDRPGSGNFYHTAAVPIMFVVVLGIQYAFELESLQGAAIAYMVATYLAAAVVAVSLWKHAAPPNGTQRFQSQTNELPAMRKASIPLMAYSLFSMAGSWLPLICLGIFATSDQVGQFGAANRLSIAIMFILLAFNSVIPARFARFYAKKDLAAIDRLARSSSAVMTAVALPLTLFYILKGAWILSWMGPDFQPAVYAIGILAVGQLINVATGSVGYLLMMTGHERELRRAATLGFAVNCLGCLTMIPFWGIEGAAIAGALAIIFENVSATVLAYRKLGILSLPWPRFQTSPLDFPRSDIQPLERETNV